MGWKEGRNPVAATGSAPIRRMTIRFVDDQFSFIQLPHSRVVKIAQLIRSIHGVRCQSATVGIWDLIVNQVPYVEPQLLAGRKHFFESILALSTVVEERDLGGCGFGACVAGRDERVVHRIYVPHAARPHAAHVFREWRLQAVPVVLIVTEGYCYQVRSSTACEFHGAPSCIRRYLPGPLLIRQVDDPHLAGR